MTPTCSISVAQTCPVRGNVSANIQEHLQLMHLASSEGAQIILFPELSLTGYEIERADQLAFTEDDSRLATLVDATSSLSMTAIVGAPVRLEGRLYIAAFILGHGQTTAIYTKHRLGAFGESARRDGTVPPAEATVFLPGEHNPLIRIGGTTAAVAICADIGVPSHVQRAADHGATAYLASMFVIPSDFDGDSARLRRYAAQHSMVVTLANFGSPTGGLAAAGRSSIWSQSGDLVVQLPSRGAGVAVATETPEGWRASTVMLGGTER